MENMELYNRVREVPKNAQKTIKGGRLNGYTDINPMWRIQKLTETFGPCGIGWKYTIDREWSENGANGEVCAFVDISLYYKWNGAWSDAVPGTGGSSLVEKEWSGLYTSDECFKMALTDAISVAAKALGMGADIYWSAGRTKYDTAQDKGQEPPKDTTKKEFERVKPITCELCGETIKGVKRKDGTVVTADKMAARAKSKYGRVVCVDCAKTLEAQHETDLSRSSA